MSSDAQQLLALADTPVETQPLYAAYCSESGRTPEGQIEYDKQQFPGGCMTGFIIWAARRHAAAGAVKIGEAA